MLKSPPTLERLRRDYFRSTDLDRQQIYASCRGKAGRGGSLVIFQDPSSQIRLSGNPSQLCRHSSLIKVVLIEESLCTVRSRRYRFVPSLGRPPGPSFQLIAHNLRTDIPDQRTRVSISHIQRVEPRVKDEWDAQDCDSKRGGHVRRHAVF